MIETLLRKPAEAPAPKRAESASRKDAPRDLDSSLENAEFKNELEAATTGSENESAEVEVKAVKVTPDQKLEKPTKLINPDAVEPDLIDPKIFDPALTKDVQKAINPETVGVEVPVEQANPELAKLLAELNPQPTELNGTSPESKVFDPKMIQMMEEASANGAVENAGIAGEEQLPQIQQAMLKSPQIAQAGGRSPAIDFAQSEIDPQLMNMDDFVAQKNLVAKKNLQVNAYGMKGQNPAAKMALENGLKQTQVVNDIQAADSSSGGVNSQQFILNMMKEQSGSQKANEAAQTKVFDMSNIKSSNAEQIMTQITDYIVQAKAAKEPTVTMRVNHDDLGMIDITVTKSMQVSSDAVAINIGTHSIDGKNFFQQNSKDLFSHLTNTGINVSDFKIETPSQSAKNEFDMNHGGRQGSNSEKQFGSEQGQRRHDSDRRQDLWKLLNDEAA